jgi:hypothetical protein
VSDAADAMVLNREDGGRFSSLEVHADDLRAFGNLEVPGSLSLGSWRLRAGGSEPDPTLDLQPAADNGSLNVRNVSGTREVMLGIDEGGGIVSTVTEHDLRLSAGGNEVAMTLKADGRVGIGTAAPGERLEVIGRIKAGCLTVGDWSINTNHAFFGNNAIDQNDRRNYALAQGRAGRTFLNSPLSILFKIGDETRMVLADDGNVGIGTISPAHPIHLGGGAHCFGGQEWRNASSISCKRDVNDLTLDDALAALRDLRPVTFKYIDGDEARAGFIAEEMPDLLATGDRASLSAMEFVAVLTRVLKFQQRQIHQLSERLGLSAGDTGSAELEPGPPEPCTAQV